MSNFIERIFYFLEKIFGEVFRVESSQITIVLKSYDFFTDLHLLLEKKFREWKIFFFKTYNYWVENIWPKKFYTFIKIEKYQAIFWFTSKLKLLPTLNEKWGWKKGWLCSLLIGQFNRDQCRALDCDRR